MKELDEEARQILRRIVESMAWRQVASIDMLGACLRLVHDLDVKWRVVEQLELNLRLFRDVRTLYGELGWQDLDAVVRERAEALPFPKSRVEFGLAYYLSGVAEHVAMQGYAESSCPEFAAIARSYVEAAPRRPEPSLFLAFASDPTNRPQAQAYLETWLPIALSSFGRPGTEGDRRAVALGLRKASSEALRRDFLDRVTPLVEDAGLRVSDQQGSAAGA